MGRVLLASSHASHHCAACCGSEGAALQRTMGCLACQNGTRVLVLVPAVSLSSP